MLTLILSYIIVAIFLLLSARLLYETLFQSKEKDGAFILTGLVMGVSCLFIAYLVARSTGL